LNNDKLAFTSYFIGIVIRIAVLSALVE